MGIKKTRQQKICWLEDRFKQAEIRSVDLDYEKTIAAFILMNYSTRRLCIELLEAFRLTGVIEIEGGKITITR